jgi:hypothetical protein
MRNRRQPRSNPELCSVVQSLPKSDRAAPLARLFLPSELDLDGLAEAIRSLLEPNSIARPAAPGRKDPDLLPVPPGVSHVVEAPQAP